MATAEGLKLIIPTSVSGSGVTISETGKITFSSATTISVNQSFSSLYDNYLIVIRCLGSTANFPSIRLRNSGTDDSSSNYNHQYFSASGTGGGASRTTSTNLWYSFGTTTTNYSGGHFLLYSPFLNKSTVFISENSDSRSNATINDYAGTHNLSSSYDGFTIFPNTGSITGSLTIYGLSQ